MKKIIMEVLMYAVAVVLIAFVAILAAIWGTSRLNWNAGESGYTSEMRVEYARGLDRRAEHE